MTVKQNLFILEYLKDLNATQAAIRAGYSKKTAYSIGQRLMKTPKVKGAIDEAMTIRAERTELTQDYVIDNLREIIERCMNPDDFNPNGAIRGLELLGKHLGMFTNKIQLQDNTDRQVIFGWINELKTHQAGEA